VEFAAERFETRLVLVLGHSSCGAILATVEQLQRPSAEQSPGLRSIVDRIRPAVEGLLDDRGSPDELLREAVRANIRLAANQLRHGSAILEHRIEHEGLLVVGAEYSLDSGVVAFFDGVPDGGE
jgi:carbonic anhydrase